MASRPPAVLSKAPASATVPEVEGSLFLLTNEISNPFLSGGTSNALVLNPPTPAGESHDTSVTESILPTRDMKTFNIMSLPGMASRSTQDVPDLPAQAPHNATQGHRLTATSIQAEGSPVIKAIDDSMPCRFGDLPLEMRYQIYDYVLAATEPPIRPWRIAMRGCPPQIYEKWDCPLVDVCRATRYEISCSYYTSTVFEIDVNYLNFHYVFSWIEDVPELYRALLPDNHNLRIMVNPNLDHRFKNLRMTRRMPVWTCTEFGTDENLTTQEHRMHFLLFCQMAKWWQRCDCNITWNYRFEDRTKKNKNKKRYGPGGGDEDLKDARAMLLTFQKELVTVFECPCVDKSWTRHRDAHGRDKMEEEAGKFIKALGSWWRIELKGVEKDRRDEECVEWTAGMVALRATVDKLLR